MALVTSSLTQFLTDNASLSKNEANFAKSSATVQRNIAAFQAALPNIKSVDDLLNNRKALTVALGAFGIESIIDEKAFIKKLLTQDPTSTTSLVNQLADQRFKQFATEFGSLATDKGAKLNSSGVAASVIQAYKTVQYEEAQGNTNPAVREALYFQRLAGGVSSSLQIISDATLADVVRTVQGLPKEFSALDPTRQVAMLKAEGFDPTKLKDPTFLKTYVERYLVNYDIQNPPNGDPTGGLAQLFQPPGDPSDPASFITPINLSSLVPASSSSSSSDPNNLNASLVKLFA
jgi:Protein of unknown function (DUF1217)